MIDSSSIGGGGNSNIFPQNMKNSSPSIAVGYEYLRYGMKVFIYLNNDLIITKCNLDCLTEFKNVKICCCFYKNWIS